jgi:hypothetical protein
MGLWFRKLAIMVAAATFGLTATVVAAQASPTTLNWGSVATAAPPAREFAAMSFDSVRNRTVLFGGGNAAFVNLSDTWEFDGANWVQSNPSTSPPALVGSAMAFDSNRKLSVLFGGGSSTGNSSDTWEWDGTTWVKRALATAPPARLWTTMAFDSARGQIVLFGGSGGGGAELGDTWTYDGVAWTLKSPSNAPSARYGAAMAFDPGLGRVVLFGGRAAGQRMADTWQWDGTSWTQLAPSSAPFPRFWHSMAYDTQVGHVVVFGGDHIEPFGLGPTNDTWQWDGAQWTQDWTSGAPSARAGHTMAPDANGRIVMFGGSDEGNPGTFPTDTWELGTGIATPPGNPAVTFNPTSGEFGQVNVGSTGGPARFNVSSSGTGPLLATISTTGDFALSSTTCPSAPDPLAAGSFCKVFVSFTPTAPGDRFGSLVFTDNGPGGSQSVPLHGTGLGSDFTISASPTTLNMLQGSSATDSISTTVLGTAGTVSLSALTTDPGLTATFSPASITAGGGSTMTVTVGSSVPTGPQSVRVVGTEGSVSHFVDVAVNVSAPPDFSISASPSSVSVNAGSSSTVAITTAITSGGAQSVALSASGLPTGATATFGANPIASGSPSSLLLATSPSTPPGTYTVTVTGTGTTTTHTTTVALTVTPVIVNGGFETGDFTGWSRTGVTAIVKTAHSGKFAARVGSTSPSKTSTLAQTFTVPTGGGTLSFWYRMTCPDTVMFDWFTVILRDGATGTTTTLLPRVCSTRAAWTHVTANLSSHAGHSVTLTFVNHDDNFAGDPTYTLVDDVSLT